MQQPPTIDRLRSGPPTVDLITAATALGIGRTRAYDLARRGEFPVTVRRIGASYRVPVAALLEFLGISLAPPQRAGDTRPSVPRQRTGDRASSGRIDPPAENPW
jgi:hypothetical protein